jgi:C4-dicarboxylate-specific signal transduction histidine kinase
MQLGTDRIREIVLSLHNFSRLDEPEFKTVDIHEGIENTLLILKHRCKAKPECPNIELLRNYGHLFMNILTNAMDALDEMSAKRSFQENQKNPS